MKPTDAGALAGLFRLSRDAVLGVRDGRIFFLNPAAERLFGADAAGKALGALLPGAEPGAEEDDLSAAVTVGGRAFSLTAGRWEDVTVYTLRPEESAAPIPPAALSRLRTAAANVRFSIDLLSAAGPEEPRLASLNHSYYSLLRVTERLSDWNDLAAGELAGRMTTLDLGKLAGELADSVSFFAGRRGVTVRCRADGETICVRGDRDRLEQLLLILIANSLEAMSGEGEIVLTVRRMGDRALLTVEDSGRGMSAADLAGAFAPREEAELSQLPGGAGMGLYLAQGIVRLHGGALVLRSREGEGTSAAFSLPAAEGLSLRDAETETVSPRRILTELADLLPTEAYGPKYLD